MDERQLQNAWRNRQGFGEPAPLAHPLARLMKHHLAKRVRQVGILSAIWDECIPDFIREHTALVKFSRGTLTVAVDSAPHRYQLQQLLANGLEGAIRERFPSALDRIRLVPGSFDYLDMPDKPGGRPAPPRTPRA